MRIKLKDIHSHTHAHTRTHEPHKLQTQSLGNGNTCSCTCTYNVTSPYNVGKYIVYNSYLKSEHAYMYYMYMCRGIHVIH